MCSYAGLEYGNFVVLICGLILLKEWLWVTSDNDVSPREAGPNWVLKYYWGVLAALIKDYFPVFEELSLT